MLGIASCMHNTLDQDHRTKANESNNKIYSIDSVTTRINWGKDSVDIQGFDDPSASFGFDSKNIFHYYQNRTIMSFYIDSVYNSYIYLIVLESQMHCNYEVDSFFLNKKLPIIDLYQLDTFSSVKKYTWHKHECVALGDSTFDVRITRNQNPSFISLFQQDVLYKEFKVPYYLCCLNNDGENRIIVGYSKNDTTSLKNLVVKYNNKNWYIDFKD